MRRFIGTALVVSNGYGPRISAFQGMAFPSELKKLKFSAHLAVKGENCGARDWL